MKPRKVYLRNNILHVCFKGYYAPREGAESAYGTKDLLHVEPSALLDDAVAVSTEGNPVETWVKTDVDAADPKRKVKVPVALLAPRNPPRERTPEEEAEDDEADLRELEARVQAKSRAAQTSRAEKVGNILDL